MLTFYFTPGASSMATHIALHEVGAPFESRLISLTKHENRTPEYLALNPEGKVPTLVIDGRPLTEVAANLWYLAKRFPDAGLLPRTTSPPKPRSFPGCRLSRRPSIRRAGSASSVGRRCSSWRERRLGQRDWAIGRYSIADIHLFRLCVLALLSHVEDDTAGLPRPQRALRSDDGAPRREANL